MGERKYLSTSIQPIQRPKVYRARRGQKRTAAQHEHDLVFVAKLYLKGYTVNQIAEILNENRTEYQLSPSQISSDIKFIHQRWMESYLVDFDVAKAKELAHIDQLETTYWEAWTESLKRAEIVDTEQVKDNTTDRRGNSVPAYSRTKVRKREKSSYGDTAILQGIQWCIEQRCKILGLNVSTQNINVNWRKQAEQAGVDPDGVVDELVKQFTAAASIGASGKGSLGENPEDTQR